MPDTIRTVAELQALLADVAPAHSTNRQLIRDLLVSVAYPVGDVRRHAANLNGIDDDVAEVQAELNVVQVIPVQVPLGTALLTVLAATGYDWRDSALPVHRALAVTRSNLTLTGPGVLRPFGYIGAGVNDLMYALATDLNTALGTLQNIRFDDVRVDLDPTGSPESTNLRAFHLIGISGLRILDAKVASSTTRNGYVAHIDNCEFVRIAGGEFRRVSGGLNFAFCNDVVISDLLFDDFNEAIDIQAENRQFQLSNLVFRGNADRGQCLDINGAHGVTVRGVDARDTANILTINYFTNVPDNYPDYTNAVAPGAGEAMVTREISISHVRGEDCGTDVDTTVHIGNNWTAQPHIGYAPVSDVTLEDWKVRDSWHWIVRGVKRLTLRDITLINTTTIAAGSIAAALQFEGQTQDADAIAWSDLDATLENVAIEGCNREGVKVTSPSRFIINGLKTAGCNTLADSSPDLRITALHARAGFVQVDGLDAAGNVTLNGDSTVIAAWAISTAYKVNALVVNGGLFYQATVAGTSAGAGGPTGTGSAIVDNTVTWKYLEYPYRLVWGRNNRIKGTLTLQGDMHEWIQGQRVTVDLGSFAATGSTSNILYTASRTCRIARLSCVTTADVVANASNYRQFLIRRWRAGALTTITSFDTATTGFLDHEARSSGFAVNEAAADLQIGDSLSLDLAHVGTGVVVTGLSATFEVLEY